MSKEVFKRRKPLPIVYQPEHRNVRTSAARALITRLGITDAEARLVIRAIVDDGLHPANVGQRYLRAIRTCDQLLRASCVARMRGEEEP